MINRHALADALAARYREILPDALRVRSDQGCIRIEALPPSRHAGSTLVCHGIVPLMLPLPAKLRLRLFFENELDGVREFVSKVQGSDWPAPGATPHVRFDGDEIHVWLGSDDGAAAPLRLRPFSRSELGL